MTIPLTPAQRRLQAQAAIDARWSRLPHDQRTAATQAARDAITAKYLRLVDPDGVLDEDERHQLARQARRADLRRAALKASRQRSARLAAKRNHPGDPQQRAEALAVADHDCPECGQVAGKGCSNHPARLGRPLVHPHAARMAASQACTACIRAGAS